MRWSVLLAPLLIVMAHPADAATGSGTGGAPAVTTITMDFTLDDSITLTITGNPLGNTTLAAPDTALNFGSVYYGYVGPLGTAGTGYVNAAELNEYVIASFFLDVTVSGLPGTADITASEGVGATYSDPANVTAIVTDLGAVTPWAVDGIAGVNDLQANPLLGTATNLVQTTFEAGFRVGQTASGGLNSVPFVFTATPN